MILQATATHCRHGFVKCSGYTSQSVDGHYHVGNPNVMLMQIWYNNRLDNSVTSAECQRRDGKLSIERRVALFLTVLSQILMPVAFLGKRPNFRLERNLLRRDEVVRKRSSRGVVLRGLPDLGRSATFTVC